MRENGEMTSNTSGYSLYQMKNEKREKMRENGEILQLYHLRILTLSDGETKNEKKWRNPAALSPTILSKALSLLDWTGSYYY